jgi:hypothetical protein
MRINYTSIVEKIKECSKQFTHKPLLKDPKDLNKHIQKDSYNGKYLHI